MRKLSTYSLNLIISILILSGCSQREWYKKEIKLNKEYANQLLLGRSFYYQGSVAEQFQLEEAIRLDSTNGSIWREIATAPLKRGFADIAFYYYEEGVKRKPERWMGFRGHCYLNFYRDYKRAIQDFNAYDDLMYQVEYSQGQNHDYLRGLCYYGLKDYKTAFVQFDKYIDPIIEADGEDWVDVYAFLFRGLTLEKLGQYEEALVEFERVLKYYPQLSDAYYHKARILTAKGNFTDALDLLRKAKDYHQEGYYHQDSYVEMLEQIYLIDIEELINKLSTI